MAGRGRALSCVVLRTGASCPPARQLSALQRTQPALAPLPSSCIPHPAALLPAFFTPARVCTSPAADPLPLNPRSERMAELLQQQPFGDKAQRYYMTRNDEYTESLKGAVGIW